MYQPAVVHITGKHLKHTLTEISECLETEEKRCEISNGNALSVQSEKGVI
jgi:hypothetical protein